MIDAAVLTLSMLDAYDPRHTKHGNEHRYLCPLSTDCEQHTGAAHRSLSVNVQNGVFLCHRCGARGLLIDFRDSSMRSSPSPTRQHRSLLPSTLPPMKTKLQPEAFTVNPDWVRVLDIVQEIEETPGADYLRGRGLPLLLARASAVQYAANIYGRPAVIFPITDRSGELRAVQARHIDTLQPRMHTIKRYQGSQHNGVYQTPGALQQHTLIITEAPIDALTLAECGLPSMALCGTATPDWIGRAAMFKQTWLATDNDMAGDKAAVEIIANLSRYGVQARRLRPEEGMKDWNQQMQQQGKDALTKYLLSVIPR